MSDSVEKGLKEAVAGVLAGIILQAVLGIIPTLPNIPTHYVALFQLIPIINLIGSIVVVTAFESWGFWYLIGWLFGMWIMSSTGFVESWVFILYLVVGGVVFVLKLLKKLGEFSL